MDRKDAFDIVLNKVDESKREEVVDKLREVETRAEKLAILAEYGIQINSPQDILGDDWEDGAIELTDEELENVAGGSSYSDWSFECNCEP